MFVYRLRSDVVTLDGVVYHIFVCVPFTFCHGHTRLCGVPYVCLVYRLRSVTVVLDCVVYHMFAWCTIYVISWSYLIVWCTICLFGVPFTRSVTVVLDCVVYHMFAWCTIYVISWSYLIVWCTICLFGVPFTRSVTVVLDCVVYHMFAWCTVYVLSWSYLIVSCTILWLFGVSFIICHDHTHVTGLHHVRMVYPLSFIVFVWCTVYVLSLLFSHCWVIFLFVWCAQCSVHVVTV